MNGPTEKYLDWKDFRMSVCKTHTALMPWEHTTKVLEAFEAWLSTKDYGILESNVISNEELMEHRLMRKGNGGGLPPEGDWLSTMKVGTEFLVRPKIQKTWILAKFMQAGVKNGNVLVIPMKGEEVTAPESEWLWVDPLEFCKFWEFRGIVLEPIDE